VKRTLLKAHSPVFADIDNKSVKLICVFKEIAHMGEIGFWAHPDDVEPHGPDICARAIAGEFGKVAPFPYSLADLLVEKKTVFGGMIDKAADQMHEANLGTKTQAAVHDHKVSEATLLLADTDPKPANYPLLAAAVGIDGTDLRAVANRVLTEGRARRVKLTAVETVRARAKYDIANAKTHEEANAAFAAIVWPT
jgi:hypothetical protein